jgi:hypothetical protein
MLSDAQWALLEPLIDACRAALGEAQGVASHCNSV